MSSQYPPITPKEAIDIAKAFGWQEHPNPPRTAGDHKFFLHPDFDHPLQIDMGENDFREYYIKAMMRRMKVSREEFYGATKRTARKIGLKFKKTKPPKAE